MQVGINLESGFAGAAAAGTLPFFAGHFPAHTQRQLVQVLVVTVLHNVKELKVLALQCLVLLSSSAKPADQHLCRFVPHSSAALEAR
jgi:hypothetical protein